MDNGRVGFRDIYRAVGESEARIISRIDNALSPLTASVTDHEMRIRVLEQYSAALTQDERLSALSRLSTLESKVSFFVDRESGVMSTLGAGKTFILILAALASPIIAMAALVIAVVNP